MISKPVGDPNENKWYSAKQGPTDEGHSVYADILSGAAILAAAYNSAKAVEIALDQWKMAKKYWEIAKWWLDHYKSHFAPVEDQEIEEALNLEHEEPEYETSRGRHRTVAHLRFKGVIRKAMKCTSEYCTGLRRDMLEQLMSAQAEALALADGLGYRNERVYVENREDVRFNKMLNTAKRGRDLFTGNVSFAKTAANAYGEAFEQTWAGLTGAGEYLGYMGNRNPTRYPMEGFSNSRDSIAGAALTGEWSLYDGSRFASWGGASYDLRTGLSLADIPSPTMPTQQTTTWEAQWNTDYRQRYGLDSPAARISGDLTYASGGAWEATTVLPDMRLRGTLPTTVTVNGGGE